MKLGLYSITYLGVWYRGDALTLEQVIDRAREYSATTGSRSTANGRTATRSIFQPRDASTSGAAPRPPASRSTRSPPTTISAARFPSIAKRSSRTSTSLIALTADLGAPVLRMFAAWPGVTFESSRPETPRPPRRLWPKPPRRPRHPRPKIPRRLRPAWAGTMSLDASGPRPTRACRASRPGPGAARDSRSPHGGPPTRA